jgi:hypothetical protein
MNVQKFVGALIGVVLSGLVYAADVVEYRNDLDFGSEVRFFMTADPVEQSNVDSGAMGHWVRTGNSFRSGGNTRVCRFYGSQNPGPNSHFYTADTAECQGLDSMAKSIASPPDKRWNLESYDFATTAPVNGTCASGQVPVYRAYNNGFARGVDSNHRFTTSLTAIAEVVARGWISEGVQMCAPSDVLHYTDKVYALWTASYPFAVTKTGVTKVVNRTSFVNTLSDYSYFNCWLAAKPLSDGRVLASCQETRTTHDRKSLYIDPTRNEMYDYVDEVPADTVWHDVTPSAWLKPGVGPNSAVSDGWYFTTDYATWTLYFQSSSTGATAVVKEGSFATDETIRLLMTYTN